MRPNRDNVLLRTYRAGYKYIVSEAGQLHAASQAGELYLNKCISCLKRDNYLVCRMRDNYLSCSKCEYLGTIAGTSRIPSGDKHARHRQGATRARCSMQRKTTHNTRRKTRVSGLGRHTWISLKAPACLRSMSSKLLRCKQAQQANQSVLQREGLS